MHELYDQIDEARIKRRTKWYLVIAAIALMAGIQIITTAIERTIDTMLQYQQESFPEFKHRETKTETKTAEAAEVPPAEPEPKRVTKDLGGGFTVEYTEGEVEMGESWVGFNGTASWYDYSLIGHPGYSKTNATAASRDYKRGSRLRVCRLDDPGRCVDVIVNDYGPQERTGRVIDLSSYAFRQLEELSRGLVNVSVTEIK